MSLSSATRLTKFLRPRKASMLAARNTRIRVNQGELGVGIYDLWRCLDVARVAIIVDDERRKSLF